MVVGRTGVGSICDGWVRFVICGCGFNLGWLDFFFSFSCCGLVAGGCGGGGCLCGVGVVEDVCVVWWW